jgi:hypothetical protein
MADQFVFMILKHSGIYVYGKIIHHDFVFHNIHSENFWEQSPYIQAVLKMAHNVYVTRIYVEYQTKHSDPNLFLDEYFSNNNYILPNMTLMTILVTFGLYSISKNHPSLVSLVELCVIDAVFLHYNERGVNSKPVLEFFASVSS